MADVQTQDEGGHGGLRISAWAIKNPVPVAVLFVALLLVANGHSGWGWAYFGYSLFNGLTGWLILSRRV